MRPALQILQEDLADVERAGGGDVLNPSPPRFRLYTVAELANLPKPTPLVSGVIARGTTVGLIAPYASYKSFVALDLALSIATGLDWHGRTVARGPVVFVVAEGASGTYRRVEAWRQLNRLPDVGNIYFLPAALILNDPRDAADFREVIAALPEPPAAIFLDTLSRTMRGTDKDDDTTKAYFAACDHIREATGATIVLVHHTGWEATRSRGSSNIPASLDTEITLTRDGEQVTVKLSKVKDALDGVLEGPILTLEAVPIGGSIGLQAIEPHSAKLTKNELRALREVQDAPLRWTQWLEATGLQKSSLLSARNRLRDLAYVKESREGYHATDAGRLSLGSKFKAGSTEVQHQSPGEVQRAHTPKGVSTEPGAPDIIPAAA